MFLFSIWKKYSQSWSQQFERKSTAFSILVSQNSVTEYIHALWIKTGFFNWYQFYINFVHILACTCTFDITEKVEQFKSDLF